MRRRGFLALLVILLITGGFGFLFGEKLLERRLEKTATSILGTKVEIDHLKLYRDPALSFDKLRIVDPNNPRENLIEIGRVAFFIKPAPLLYGKIIIDQIRVTDIQFWTQRKSTGATTAENRQTSPWLSKIERTLRSQLDTPPIDDLLLGKRLALDELISLLEVPSLSYLDSLKLAVDSIYNQSVAFLSELKTETDVRSNDSNETSRGLLNKNFDTVTRRVKKDFEKLAIGLIQADNLIRTDLSSLKNKSIVFRIDRDTIGKMLYGDLAVRAIVEILRYVEVIRKNMPVTDHLLRNAKLTNPRRSNGQDIHFPITNSIPKFLIKEFIVRSPENQKEAKDTLRVRGEISGITSHPQTYGEVQKIEISARWPNPRKYGIIGTIDHTRDEPWEQFQLLGTGFELFSFDLPEHRFLPKKIITDRGKLGAGFELQGNQIEAQIGITGMPASFVFSETAPGDTSITKKIEDLLESKKRFYIGVRLNGTPDSLAFKVYSSADAFLAEHLQKILHKSARWDESEIYTKVDSLLTAKKHELMEVFKKRQDEVAAEIDRFEALIR